MKAFADAAAQLQSNFDAAIEERNRDILPEFERSTSVATRRDRVLRDDDMRKQMKPEEFKRTVAVLTRVMAPSVVMQNLSTTGKAGGAGTTAGDVAASSATTSRSLPADAASAAAAPALTLEQRLERLEQAAVAMEASKSPASTRSRHHHR
jgi:hypothetical protein